MSSDYGLYESDSYKASRLEQENVELRSRLQAAEEKDKRWQDEMDVACKKILLHTRKIRSLEEAIERVRAKYNELLLAVEDKHEGQSRHETALRYIQAVSNG